MCARSSQGVAMGPNMSRAAEAAAPSAEMASASADRTSVGRRCGRFASNVWGRPGGRAA